MSAVVATAPPTLRFEKDAKVVPGDRIGTIRQVLPGVGTYAKGGNVYASVLGRIDVCSSSSGSVNETAPSMTSATTTTAAAATTTTAEPPLFVVSVKPLHKNRLASSQVIAVGQRVLGRITRVAAPQATVEILAVQGVGTLRSQQQQYPPPEGSIGREDAIKAVAATAAAGNKTSSSSSREIQDCFQPGDIVLAKVLSLGDSRRYFLTTAEADLGVIHAICHASGKPMIPCSWKEMECPDTGIKEARKCAKPRTICGAAAAGSGGIPPQQEQ